MSRSLTVLLDGGLLRFEVIHRGLHRYGEARRLDHLDHVHIVARSHFACVASVRSRTDSRVTAVVAASAAMVVATVPLTIPRRSLGCRSVPVAPQRTHVSTLLSREDVPRAAATHPFVVDDARDRSRLITRLVVVVVVVGVAPFRAT